MKTYKAILLVTALCLLALSLTAYAERTDAGKFTVRKVESSVETVSVKAETMTFSTTPAEKLAVEGKQGGEDISSAVQIPSLPYDASGTTATYANDYDEQCPNSSASPDVVYYYDPPNGETVDIITCGSGYWTKLFVYENDETNLVACNQYSDTCWAQQSSYQADIYGLQLTAGNTYYIVVDGWGGQSGTYDLHMEAWPPIDTLNTHPALADNGTGLLVNAYEWQEYGNFIPWWSSIDFGENWSGGIGWNFDGGIATYPSLEYQMNDTVFYGSVVPPNEFFSGGPMYLINIQNAVDMNSAGGSYWNFSTNGWHDMHMADIACAASPNPDSAWEWGMQSLVHSTTYTTPEMIDGPHLFYQTDSEGYASISWYNDLDGCNTTTCDIDRSTYKTYASYDHYNDSLGLWELFVRQDNFANWDDEVFPGGYTFNTDDSTNVAYPATGSYGGNVLVITENWDGLTPEDRDLLCWNTQSADIGSFVSNVVIATAESERFPEVQHIAGAAFLCTYIQNNELYATLTEDGGLTWGTPEVISEVGDSVVSEYRAVDIAESDGYAVKIQYEYIVPGAKGAGSIWLRMISHQVYPYPDGDGDGVPDHLDNCPNTYNDDQADNDGDDLGDVCDNCILVYNPGQENNDADTLGNACDNCPDADNDDQVNSDGDLLGDVCDNCVSTDNQDQANGDADTFGDACDNCPADDNEDQANGDADTHGDVCDNCPADDNEDQLNSDADSHGDVCDNCPMDDNEDQADANSNGVGDVCDWVCGDATDNGSVDILDITFLISFKYKDGPAPVNLVACDVNSSGTALDPEVNILDITYLIAYKYQGGAAPNCP